jgi:hypothetical protein
VANLFLQNERQWKTVVLPIHAVQHRNRAGKIDIVAMYYYLHRLMEAAQSGMEVGKQAIEKNTCPGFGAFFLFRRLLEFCPDERLLQHAGLYSDVYPRRDQKTV